MFALVAISHIKNLALSDNEIAQQVTKVGGGHPSRNAIRVLREKFAADAGWFPGKIDEGAGQPGRPKSITPQQEQALAKCAMALKRNGKEPSAPAVIASCPVASVNKHTGEVFTHKVILNVFRTRCYDTHPEVPWAQQCAKQKTALTPDMVARRLGWGQSMLRLNHNPGWYHRHCIWMDPCSSILPGRPKSVFDQHQATYGKAKRWMSVDSKDIPRNQRASPYAGKQAQWGDVKVWWFVVLSKGKAQVDVMPVKWTQNGEGQSYMVSRLPLILTTLLGDTGPKPSVLFTDRGPGFYHPSTGNICPEYMAALVSYGFTPWAGEHALWQPPDIPDLLLHETVVAWIRKYLKKHPVKLYPDQHINREILSVALADAAAHINQHYDVEKLGMSFPRRLHELVHAKQGGRLKY